MSRRLSSSCSFWLFLSYKSLNLEKDCSKSGHEVYGISRLGCHSGSRYMAMYNNCYKVKELYT